MLAEKSLLGALLSGYPDALEIMLVVHAEDFLHPHHEGIYAAIATVVEAGHSADPLTVRVAMGAASNRLPGGAVYLVELAQTATSIASAPHYAQEVAAEAQRRRIAAAGIRLGQLAQAGLGQEEVSDEAQSIIEAATSMRHKRTTVSIGDVLPDVLDIAQHGQTKGLSTGWVDIDDLITGLTPGRFIVIAARPGGGKSLAGTNLALHVAHHHHKAALLCSMEMSRDEVTQRIVSAHTGANLTGLEHGNTSESAWDTIAAKTDEVMNLPILIEDAPSQSLTSIRATLRHTLREHGEVPLVVVDYLQLIRPRDRKVNRVEQLGEISRGLKLMAREFNTCVVAMAQLNRESIHRAGGRPDLADLRGSGDIEADADVVILLHRNDDSGEVDVLVEKNRSGPRGQTSLILRGNVASLSSAVWDPTRYAEEESRRMH